MPRYEIRTPAISSDEWLTYTNVSATANAVANMTNSNATFARQVFNAASSSMQYTTTYTSPVTFNLTEQPIQNLAPSLSGPEPPTEPQRPIFDAPSGTPDNYFISAPGMQSIPHDQRSALSFWNAQRIAEMLYTETADYPFVEIVALPGFVLQGCYHGDRDNPQWLAFKRPGCS